jgi:hypothetical protein
MEGGYVEDAIGRWIAGYRQPFVIDVKLQCEAAIVSNALVIRARLTSHRVGSTPYARCIRGTGLA